MVCLSLYYGDIGLIKLTQVFYQRKICYSHNLLVSTITMSLPACIFPYSTIPSYGTGGSKRWLIKRSAWVWFEPAYHKSLPLTCHLAIHPLHQLSLQVTCRCRQTATNHVAIIPATKTISMSNTRTGSTAKRRVEDSYSNESLALLSKVASSRSALHS